MKLRDKLDEKRAKTRYDIEYKKVIDAVERRFLAPDSNYIIPGCRVLIKYEQRIINYELSKAVYVQFLQNEDCSSAKGNQEMIILEYCNAWEDVKGWAKWYANMQGLTAEVLDDKHFILTLIY